MVHPICPEKTEARRKGIDVQTHRHPRADIFHAIGQGVGQFQFRSRPRLLHVVT